MLGQQFFLQLLKGSLLCLCDTVLRHFYPLLPEKEKGLKLSKLGQINIFIMGQPFIFLLLMGSLHCKVIRRFPLSNLLLIFLTQYFPPHTFLMKIFIGLQKNASTNLKNQLDSQF